VGTLCRLQNGLTMPWLQAASSTASAQWGGVASWSSYNIVPTTPGWITIAEERVGAGNASAFDGDRHAGVRSALPEVCTGSTLWTSLGSRHMWKVETTMFGSSGAPRSTSSSMCPVAPTSSTRYITLRMQLACTEHGMQSSDDDFAIDGVTTSVSSPDFGETATFCHACVTGGSKPGHTCWAVTPSSDTNRSCGCSGESWAGEGIYMGGYKASSKCDGQGGGFAGAKVGGAAKGNLDSIGFVMKIRGRASGRLSSRRTVLIGFVGYTTTSGSFNSSTAHRSM
jgi:hypothetical protein